MGLGTGPCLSLADLAAQVSEAIDELQTGIDGTSPTVEVGTVSLLGAGETPTVVDSEEGPNVVLDFGFPPGGVAGADGADGQTPDINIASPVLVLAPGENPTVSDINADPVDVTLQFGLPEGVDGTNGTVVRVIEPTITLDAGMDATVDVFPYPDEDPPAIELLFSIPRGASGGGATSLKPPVIIRIKTDTTGEILGSYDTDDGTLPVGSEGETLTIMDTKREGLSGEIEGYGEFADPGQIWLAEFSEEFHEYEVIHELRPLEKLTVEVNETLGVTPGDGTDTFSADNLEVVSGRLPVDALGADLTEITVTNKGQISAVDDDVITVYFDRTVTGGTEDESDRWVTFPSGNQSVVIVLVDQIDGASQVDGAKVKPGVGAGVLMELVAGEYVDSGVPNIDVYNLSRTPIGNQDFPTAVSANLQPDGTYLIASDKDFTGTPLFDNTKKQILAHAENTDTFTLQPFCYDHQFVGSVHLRGDLTELYYKTVQGDCVVPEPEVSIINLGFCSTPPASALSAGDWEVTGFGY